MHVPSFNVNHDLLEPGVYISRVDDVAGNPVTTFDLRFKKPNREAVLSNAAIHSLEHLMAVWLRDPANPFAEKVIYIGPMGCRTGFYWIVKGSYNPLEMAPLLKSMFESIIAFSGPVPATSSVECGNCADHDLPQAQAEARQYYQNVLLKLESGNTQYPA